MENNIRPVTTPEEAIAQFIGEQYMEWLMNYLGHEVKTWVSLKTIAEVKPRPEKIKKFMLQRFLAAEAFTGRDGDPGFLGFAIANLSESSDPLAENALELLESKRKAEVSGVGSATEQSSNVHRQLWMKLLKALEVSDDELRRVEAKEPTRNYIAELSDVYSNAEWQTTMAAFAAHEKLIPDEYGAIITMLQNNLKLNSADLEVLTWHSKGDAKYVIEAGHILEGAAADEEGKALVFEGVKRQLEARRDFYDALANYLYDN
jgi:thiaminase